MRGLRTDVAPDPPPNVESAYRGDGWRNYKSGMGTAKDKGTGTVFGACNVVGRQTLSDLYRTDGIAAKIIDRPVWDSVRAGWVIDVQAQKTAPVQASEPIDSLMGDELKRIGAKDGYSTGRKWARLYGNALVVAYADDVTDGILTEELTSYGQINRLGVVAGGKAGPLGREYSNPDDASEVTMWVVNPHGKQSTQIRIHPSRAWLIQGVELPPEVAQHQDCWDDSVIQRIHESLSRVATADATGVTFLSERSQPIWRIKGLTAQIAKRGVDAMASRFEALTQNRSVYNSIVLDRELEDFEVMDSAATGISDLLEIYPSRVAATSNIPVTILYGTSPGGMNATGDSDFRGYYDFVSGSEQADHLDPFLTWLTRMVMAGNQGPTRGASVPFTVRFNPLSQPTAAEISTTRKTNADTDNVYFTIGVLSEQEIRESRFGGSEYGTEITIDPDADISAPDTGEQT